MMKRLLGILLTLVLLISALAGCGAASKSESATAPDFAVSPVEAPAANNMEMRFSEAAGEAKESDGGAADIYGSNGGATATAQAAAKPARAESEITGIGSLAGTGNTGVTASNTILNERKIIRSANLTIEVENFDEATNNINGIIRGIGIVQDSNVSTERYYVGDKVKLIRRGTIVLRVVKEKFDSVFNNLKGIGDVLNEQINGQDVTDQYIDIESRLRVLKLEQSKLELYLERTNDLDQIFKIESRLTEVRQQIENLTGNLKQLSSLVELSTITLTVNEKYPDQESKVKPDTYWQKLARHLKSSLEGVISFLGDLLIFLIAAIPVLIVIGLFVLLGVFIFRRIPRRKKAPAYTQKEVSPTAVNPESDKDNQK